MKTNVATKCLHGVLLDDAARSVRWGAILDTEAALEASLVIVEDHWLEAGICMVVLLQTTTTGGERTRATRVDEDQTKAVESVAAGVPHRRDDDRVPVDRVGDRHRVGVLFGVRRARVLRGHDADDGEDQPVLRLFVLRQDRGHRRRRSRP